MTKQPAYKKEHDVRVEWGESITLGAKPVSAPLKRKGLWPSARQARD